MIDLSVAIYPYNKLNKNYMKIDQWLIQWKLSSSKLGFLKSKLAKGD